MRQMQQQRTDGRIPTSDLPSTSLIQDEAQENMLDFTHQDQFVQGSSSSTIPLKVPVDNQNEIRTEVENEDSTPKVAERKKHRGPTLMVKVHQRTFHKEIMLNAKGQPIGSPSVVIELAGFLGTIAKDPMLAPINILDWKCMPTKNDIWDYVKKKFKITEEGKTYVLQTVNDNWRVYKSRLKSKHYKPYQTDEERWKNRPYTIPDNQFRELLDYWDSPVGKEIAHTNATNRQKHEDVHTIGPRSIARLRYDLEKIGTLQQQIEKGDKGKDVDPYSEVIAKEHNSRAFLQGRGLKNSALKGKERKGSYLQDKEFFQNMKEEWVEELIPTLTSKVLSQIQAAYPHLDFNLPNITSAPDSSNQLTKEINLHNDDGTHLSQDNGFEDEDVEGADVEDDN